MSNELTELKSLLQSAATDPEGEPDLARVEHRGRVLRARRRASRASIAAVLVVSGALAVTAMANPKPDRSNSSSAVVAAAAPVCPRLSTATNDIPSWAESARPPRRIPHLLSRERNVIAFLFGHPLRAGHPTKRRNKILFVMRERRNGRPLRVTGTLAGRKGATHATIKGNTSPGEIYPSIIDVPAPGCWHFALRWNGHRASINLVYRNAVR